MSDKHTDAPAAWMTEDGRVVPASTMTTAQKDGGATLSSMRAFSIPLFRATEGQAQTSAAALDQYGTLRCASCDANIDINEEHGDDCSQVAAAPLPQVQPLSRDAIRAIFMAHGFTVKAGETDLKQYVFDAAAALLAAGAGLPQVQSEALEDGRAKFINTFCKNSASTWLALSEYYQAIPCDCGEEACHGWQMKSHTSIAEEAADQQPVTPSGALADNDGGVAK